MTLYHYDPLENTVLRDGLFFGAVRHSFLTLKNGMILPGYLMMKGT